MRTLIFSFAILLSATAFAQERRLYVKAQINFQFPLVKTIRQDPLPYAKIINNHRSAVIGPGLRIEYVKANGNGYFLNFTTVPLGSSVSYRDYSSIDYFYQRRLPSLIGSSIHHHSTSHTAIAFDVGLVSRLATMALLHKSAFDVKFAYGLTFASFRPYYDIPFVSEGPNAEGKTIRFFTSNIALYDNNRSKLGVMVPVKLDFNIKSKQKNVERLNLEIAYWHSFSRSHQDMYTYHNVTDNVTYENVVESKGTTWQLSVQVPIRIKRIGKKVF